MSNSQSFDFSSLKKMPVDNLIMKCKGYVEQYLSKSAADRLDKAYKASKFDEVKHILDETLKKVEKKIKKSEYQKAKQAVLDELSDAEKLFESFDNTEGRQTDNMGTGIVIVIIVAILVIAIAIVKPEIYLKANKIVGEILSLGHNKSNNVPKYTDKDRDMIALIHELTIIYDNTDQYLNS